MVYEEEDFLSSESYSEYGEEYIRYENTVIDYDITDIKDDTGHIWKILFRKTCKNNHSGPPFYISEWKKSFIQCSKCYITATIDTTIRSGIIETDELDYDKIGKECRNIPHIYFFE